MPHLVKLGVRMEFRDSLNKCAMALAKNLDRSEFGNIINMNWKIPWIWIGKCCKYELGNTVNTNWVNNGFHQGGKTRTEQCPSKWTRKGRLVQRLLPRNDELQLFLLVAQKYDEILKLCVKFWPGRRNKFTKKIRSAALALWKYVGVRWMFTLLNCVNRLFSL